MLGAFRASRLIELEPMPPYGPRLRVSDSGHNLLDRFPKTLARYADSIAFVARNLGSRGVNDLEKIGTALFVLREHPKAGVDERAQALMALKPQVDEAAALKAVQEVDSLLKQAAA